MFGFFDNPSSVSIDVDPSDISWKPHLNHFLSHFCYVARYTVTTDIIQILQNHLKSHSNLLSKQTSHLSSSDYHKLVVIEHKLNDE